MPILTRFLTLFAILVFGTVAQAAKIRTVILDPGHGGRDLGGNWGKVYEKHLALDTAVRLKTRLQSMGYKVVMTRESDNYISLPGRTNLANRYRDAIFVSIHYNYTWKKHVSGLETFYYNQEGGKLAHYVQHNLVAKTKTVDRKAKFARYYVIRNTRLPAILVEGGFVSNAAERDRMKSGKFRETIAKAVADGIHTYNKTR